MKGRKLEQTLWCWKPVGKNPWFPIYIVIKIKAHLILLCLAILCFTDTLFFSFFNILKVCGNPAWNKPSSTIFPAAFVHSVSHFGNSCNISNIIIIFGIVICDQCTLITNAKRLTH